MPDWNEGHVAPKNFAFQTIWTSIKSDANLNAEAFGAWWEVEYTDDTFRGFTKMVCKVIPRTHQLCAALHHAELSLCSPFWAPSCMPMLNRAALFERVSFRNVQREYKQYSEYVLFRRCFYVAAINTRVCVLSVEAAVPDGYCYSYAYIFMNHCFCTK